MPTTALKNSLYRLALPVLAPRPGGDCLIRTEGSLASGEKTYLSLIRRHHVLGSAALLSDGSRQTVLYTRSDSPAHNPLETPVFRAASITKMATALAALICANRGLIDLDAPFTAAMPPEFASAAALKGVTLRHLLSHTSGLADPPDLEQALEQGKNVLETLQGCRFASPGECFRYSNLGFGLIGCLLEALFQQPVTQIMDDLVFHPLSSEATLDAASLPEERIMPVSRIFPRHPERDVTVTPLGQRSMTSPDPFRHYGHTAGSMYTDIFSLQKLLACLIRQGNPLISRKLWQEMTRSQASYGAISPTLSYGLGILRIQDARLSSSVILGHQGFAYGCADGAFWEEDTGRMLIFLNGGCSEAREGRLGLCNRDLLQWAFRKEFPLWT